MNTTSSYDRDDRLAHEREREREILVLTTEGLSDISYSNSRDIKSVDIKCQ